MTDKPDLKRIWADNGVSTDIVDPDITLPGKFTKGWVEEVPRHEHFNYLHKLYTQGLAHNNENGINEWDAETSYVKGAIVKGNDSILYRNSATLNVNNQPVPVDDLVATMPGAGWQFLLNTFKISDFGADGTSVNDTAAMALAVTTLKNGSRLIIDMDIEINDNFTLTQKDLIIEGPFTITCGPSEIHLFNFTGGNITLNNVGFIAGATTRHVIEFNVLANPNVVNCRFENGGYENEAIAIRNSEKSHIWNNKFKGFKSAIIIESSENVLISNNYFTEGFLKSNVAANTSNQNVPVGDAIKLAEIDPLTAGQNNKNITITDNVFDNVYGAALSCLTGATNIIFTNNICKDMNYNVVVLQAYNNSSDSNIIENKKINQVIISDNIIENYTASLNAQRAIFYMTIEDETVNSDDNILLTNVNIANNIVNSSTSTVINIENADGGTTVKRINISGNNFNNLKLTTNAIEFSTPVSNSVIANNVIEFVSGVSSTARGIFYNATQVSNNSVISNNIISNNDTATQIAGGIITTGDNISVTGNRINNCVIGVVIEGKNVRADSNTISICETSVQLNTSINFSVCSNTFYDTTTCIKIMGPVMSGRMNDNSGEFVLGKASFSTEKWYGIKATGNSSPITSCNICNNSFMVSSIFGSPTESTVTAANAAGDAICGNQIARSVVANNVVSGFTNGVKFIYNNQTAVVGNSLHRILTTAISIGLSSRYFIIQNNIVEAQSRGIHIATTANNFVMSNNLSYGMPSDYDFVNVTAMNNATSANNTELAMTLGQ